MSPRTFGGVNIHGVKAEELLVLEREVVELAALERGVQEVLARAARWVGAAAWAGLVGLSATLGAFAHLIWWRFDTMEPFTFMWTSS